jgi:hypothetical protein
MLEKSYFYQCWYMNVSRRACNFLNEKKEIKNILLLWK